MPAWTLRYSVGGRQREESFGDELYPGTKLVKPNSGLRKAQDFQLKLSTGKREQGRTFTDPKEGEAPFIRAAEQFIRTSGRIRASTATPSHRPRYRADRDRDGSTTASPPRPPTAQPGYAGPAPKPKRRRSTSRAKPSALRALPKRHDLRRAPSNADPREAEAQDQHRGFSARTPHRQEP